MVDRIGGERVTCPFGIPSSISRQSNGFPFAAEPTAGKERGGDSHVERHGEPKQEDGVGEGANGKDERNANESFDGCLDEHDEFSVADAA